METKTYKIDYINLRTGEYIMTDYLPILPPFQKGQILYLEKVIIGEGDEQNLSLDAYIIKQVHYGHRKHINYLKNKEFSTISMEVYIIVK